MFIIALEWVSLSLNAVMTPQLIRLITFRIHRHTMDTSISSKQLRQASQMECSLGIAGTFSFTEQLHFYRTVFDITLQVSNTKCQFGGMNRCNGMTCRFSFVSSLHFCPVLAFISFAYITEWAAWPQPRLCIFNKHKGMPFLERKCLSYSCTEQETKAKNSM